MRNLTILLLALTSIACTQAVSQTKKVAVPQRQRTDTVETKLQTKPIPMPKIEAMENAMVRRVSENKDQHGSYLPPWTEITVPLIFFKAKPVVASKVTVVPLDVDVNSFNWQIVKSERKEDGCDETSYAWEVELKPFTQKEFFEIDPLPNRANEYPFDVVVLYPAVEFARQIKKKQLTKNLLPKGVSINAVKAAIDVTNDQKPDILLLEFCCDAPTKATDCDYTCGKTFKQVNGKWKLMDEFSPC